MKEVNLPSGDYIFIEVPDDAYDFRYKIMPDDTKQLVATCKDDKGNAGTCYINENPIGEIISTTNDITKEQCKILIEIGQCKRSFHYKDYTSPTTKCKSTAKESLQSLIQSVGLDLKNNYLILKK